jgi:hypothetical protein
MSPSYRAWFLRWLSEPTAASIVGPEAVAASERATLAPFRPWACSVAHNCPDRTVGGFLELSEGGAIVQVRGVTTGGAEAEERAPRGAITEWSTASRRRLLKTCLAIDWNAFGPVLMLTLTYPGAEAPAYVPMDGELAHGHLRSFLKRWGRQWGEPARGLWKLEFQRRGAVHWTLFLAFPEGVQRTREGLALLRRFVSRAWWRVVGSRSRDHLRAGTQVLWWTGTPTAYAWKYALKKGEKEYQHRVPEGFRNVGRWWGLVGGLRPRWQAVVLSKEQFQSARRMLRRWARSRGRRLRSYGASAGLWVIAQVQGAMVTAAVWAGVLRAVGATT